jgi:hypothetical protein
MQRRRRQGAFSALATLLSPSILRFQQTTRPVLLLLLLLLLLLARILDLFFRTFVVPVRAVKRRPTTKTKQVSTKLTEKDMESLIPHLSVLSRSSRLLNSLMEERQCSIDSAAKAIDTTIYFIFPKRRRTTNDN